MNYTYNQFRNDVIKFKVDESFDYSKNIQECIDKFHSTRMELFWFYNNNTQYMDFFIEYFCKKKWEEKDDIKNCYSSYCNNMLLLKKHQFDFFGRVGQKFKMAVSLKNGDDIFFTSHLSRLLAIGWFIDHAHIIYIKYKDECDEYFAHYNHKR
jgi:hypothetical protein